MVTIAGIIGTLGGVLLLVGLVGGDFQFSGSVMPKVGNTSRVLCFGVGGVLLLTALGLVLIAPGEAGARPPDPAPTTSRDELPEPPAPLPPAPEPPAPEPPAPEPPAPEPPVPLQPAPGYVLAGSGSTAYVFAAPSSEAPVLTEIDDGALVHILCTAMGESVTSPLTGLTSSLWNFTTDGGFVPDVLVDTGTEQPTMPNCSQ
ncbi:hypothetical protein [Kineococcus vitellinus]|uniref:hypothetical protein n=1 Tax=Kineococcus vitellinus TaxID=2696565 RepID=UPI0014120064|nr:hypothetical protein [Kineococcus vitellinus]